MERTLEEEKRVVCECLLVRIVNQQKDNNTLTDAFVCVCLSLQQEW